MTKKLFLKAVLVLFIASVAAVGFILFAGIRLQVENQSQSPIENIKIDYGKGSFKTDRLAPGVAAKISLGKIGEGAEFSVTWNNGRNAQFIVYFDGLWGYDKVRIVFLPSERILLCDNDKFYEPIASERTYKSFERSRPRNGRAAQF